MVKIYPTHAFPGSCPILVCLSQPCLRRSLHEGRQLDNQCQATDHLTPRNFDKLGIYPVSSTEMTCDTRSRLLWGSPVFPHGLMVRINSAPAFFSQIFSQISVRRQWLDGVALCPKTEVLTVMNISRCKCQTANCLSPASFDEFCIYHHHWDEMRHNVEIALGNKPQHSWDRVQLLSVFISSVPLSKRSFACVSHYPKRDSLEIRAKQ